MICRAPLRLCGAVCIDVSSSTSHCGSCYESCTGGRSCEDGLCIQPGPTTNPNAIDVAALELLLALFGVTLEDFARAIGVPVSELGNTELALSDLGVVGVSIAALALLGFTEDALELIGIDVDL